jgi:hypothetical protein
VIIAPCGESVIVAVPTSAPGPAGVATWSVARTVAANAGAAAVAPIANNVTIHTKAVIVCLRAMDVLQ